MEETKQPHFNSKSCCVGLAIGFAIIVAVAIIFAWLIYKFEKNEDDKFKDRGKPESYSLLFSKYLPPDYSFPTEEQSQIETKIIETIEMPKPAGLETSLEVSQIGFEETMAKDKKTAAKEMVTKLKDHYPEGYFVIAKSLILLPDKDKYLFQFCFFNNDFQTANTEVHELSHSWGNITNGDYFESGKKFNFSNQTGHLIEDKFISYKNYYLPLPRGGEAIKYIETPTKIDKTYLSDTGQDLYSTMDEINSYIKSVRTARAYNYYGDDDINSNTAGVVLSRQLYILSLQLKYLKENHAEVWRGVKNNSASSYVLMRLVEIANNELTVAKDEGLDFSKGDESYASTIENNLKLIEENQSLLDELYTGSGIDKYRGKDLTEAELKSLGIAIEKIK